MLYIGVGGPQAWLAVDVGQQVRFSCAGKALFISWTIDNDMNADVLGLKPITEEIDGILRSNLTLPGGVENVSVQCILFLPDKPPLFFPSVLVAVSGKPSISNL